MTILNGTRVVEFGTVLAAPGCSMLLAEFGADVIKVESPAGDPTRWWGDAGDGRSAAFRAANQNKDSVVLDLTSAEGRAAGRELISSCDVMIHNLLPPSERRLGLTYVEARALRPDIVYCSISGYGRGGPMEDRPGFDLLAQAETGILGLTGPPGGGSVRNAVSAIDMMTGVVAALGVVLALLERDRTGQGRRVDTSLYETALYMMGSQLAEFTSTGRAPRKQGGRFPLVTPAGVFQAADREFVAAMLTDASFDAFCRAVGWADTIGRDDRFASQRARQDHADSLYDELAQLFATQDAAHWIEVCGGCHVPAALVSTVDEVLSAPQVAALAMLRVDGAGTGLVPRAPLRLEGVDTPCRPAPSLGNVGADSPRRR